MLASWLVIIACCVLLSTTVVVAEREWMMQDYQLAMITRAGAFCRSVKGNDGASLISCDARQAPATSSLSILPSDLNRGKRIIAGDALQIFLRPGYPTPLDVNVTDGLVISLSSYLGTTFMLTPRAGSTGLPLHFGDTGSNLLFLSAQVAGGADGTMTQKYCRTGNYTLGSTILSSILLCDLDSTEGAVQLTFRPLGWSWNDMRTFFTSVYTKKHCGALWYQNHSTPITCDSGERALASLVLTWRYETSLNVLRSMTLPMRSNTDFMVQTTQTGILTGVTMFVWQTDAKGDLVTDQFEGPSGDMAPPGNIPYLTMVKNDGPSRNTTIGAGDVVLLRSSLTGGFCRVYGRLQQVRCTYSLHDVQAAPDRTIFQFIYQELNLSEVVDYH